MPTPPPRSRRSGQKPDSLGRAEFAAAFLQRNRRYRTDRDQMNRRVAEDAAGENAARAAFARQWGLSFRLSPG